MTIYIYIYIKYLLKIHMYNIEANCRSLANKFGVWSQVKNDNAEIVATEKSNSQKPQDQRFRIWSTFWLWKLLIDGYSRCAALSLGEQKLDNERLRAQIREADFVDSHSLWAWQASHTQNHPCVPPQTVFTSSISCFLCQVIADVEEKKASFVGLWEHNPSWANV